VIIEVEDVVAVVITLKKNVAPKLALATSTNYCGPSLHSYFSYWASWTSQVLRSQPTCMT